MRRRRMIRSKHGKDRYGAVTTVLVLLLIVAFVFAFQSLGIYDILFKPAFNTNVATGSPSPGTSAAPSATGATPSPAASSSAGKISEEIKMSAITLYGVQLGVFSQQDNAEAAAAKFKQQGSAGYILKEDSLYRIVDCVYYSEADAKALRDEYRKGVSPDACILRVQASGINWKVNASREQIDAIKAAVSAVQTQLVILINTQKAAQQKQGTAADWKLAVGGAAVKFKDASTAMMKAVGSTSSDVILKFNECLLEGADTLDKLSKTDPASDAALLSGLRYCIIDMLLKLQQKIMS